MSTKSVKNMFYNIFFRIFAPESREIRSCEGDI